MAELGTALAIVAFADQCLKYGKKFVDRCKSYLHAEAESIELLITIESTWVKMKNQIQIMKKIGPELDKGLQDIQSQILSQLEGKLKTASLTMDQLIRERKEDAKAKKQLWKHDDQAIGIMVKGFEGIKFSQKAKYVTKKNSLVQIVGEIESGKQDTTLLGF